MHWLLSIGLSIAASLGVRWLRNAQLEDPEPLKFDAPEAREGHFDPYVFGRVEVLSPNTVWWGDRQDIERTNDVPFAPDPKAIFYFMGFQDIICRGEVDSISAMWMENKRALDWDDFVVQETSTPVSWTAENQEQSVIVPFGNVWSGAAGDYWANVTAHLGSLTQAADAYLSNFQTDTATVPAYRDRVYVASEGPSEFIINDLGFNAEISGNIGLSPRLRRRSYEVTRRVVAAANPLSLAPGERDVGTGGDNCNPANVIAEFLLTDQTLNTTLADIDLTNFGAAATTLSTEGNGVSMIIDRPIIGNQILKELEKQINGFVFRNPATNQYQIKLARADYSIPALTNVNESNAQIRTFRRTTWQGTTNQVNVRFTGYDSTAGMWRKDMIARSHDIANYEIQGRYVPLDITYMGLRDPALANDLAWRELRARNRPLANATVKGDRSLSSLLPGDVIRLNWGGNLNITDLPMRVVKIDYGTLNDGVELTLVEDVFAAEVGAYADPPDTGWEFPTSAAQAVPLTEGLVDGVAYAIARRKGVVDDLLDFIWVGSPIQTDESHHIVYAREGTDPYEIEASYGEFVFLGTLDATLGAGTAQPHATPSEDIDVTGLGYPLQQVEETRTLVQLGQNLEHLIRIDDELMLARDIDNTNDTLYELKRVYRGVLDTARRPHASSSNVFLWVDSTFHHLLSDAHPQGSATNVQFRPLTIDGELAAGSANTESITPSNRGRKPYPPTEIQIGPNGSTTRYPTGTISLDSTTDLGSNDDQQGFDVEWNRRDYRVLDEVTSATVDAGNLTATVTEYRLTITEDPGGTPDLLFSTAWASSSDALDTVTRTEILANNDGVIPTGTPDDLRVAIETRHTFDSVVREAVQDEQWDFDVSSAELSGLTNTGARQANVASTNYAIGSYVGLLRFTMGTDLLTSGNLEANIDSGGWVTVIGSADGLTGTISVAIEDTNIQWRHTQTGGSNNTYTHVDIEENAGNVNVAYGIMIV